MKITDVKAFVIKGRYKSDWPDLDRLATPLDYYDEYLGKPNVFSRSIHLKQEDPEITSKIMIQIETDEGVCGIHLPVEAFMQAEIVLKTYKHLLIGKDPMATRMLWDMMDRSMVYMGRTGLLTTALAAIDNALWDLKGKITGQPVYKLLGGGRDKLQPYISTLGCNVDDMDKVREYAIKIRDMNVYGQKWFFKYGPNSGTYGIEKNLELAHTLRNVLGKNYNIIFDAWTAWDLSYCIEMFRHLEDIRPLWIEEPLRADRIEAFKVLRSKTNLQISCGEKLFNRFEIHEFLKEGLIDVYQPEPEYFGGITETMRTGELCELYGVKYLPHGMSLMPLLSVSAAMPPDITPCFEYLTRTVPGHIFMMKDAPEIKEGFVHLPNNSGLHSLDDEKVLFKEEISL